MSLAFLALIVSANICGTFDIHSNDGNCKAYVPQSRMANYEQESIEILIFKGDFSILLPISRTLSLETNFHKKKLMEKKL